MAVSISLSDLQISSALPLSRRLTTGHRDSHKPVRTIRFWRAFQGQRLLLPSPPMIYVHMSRTHDVVSICVYLQIIVSICPAERRVCPRSGFVATLPLAPPPHFPNDRYLPYLLTCLATAIGKRLGFGLASGIQCMLIRAPTIHQSSSRLPNEAVNSPVYASDGPRCTCMHLSRA